MTTADYALYASLAAVVVSFLALIWNVWQKYLFVKPALQVTLGIYRLVEPKQGRISADGRRILMLAVTNMGPGPAILHSCIIRWRNALAWPIEVRQPFKFWRPLKWRPFRIGYLNPIEGDPTNTVLQTKGPFSGGLPTKIEAAEVKTFNFPYDKDCCLYRPVLRVGITDTYGRDIWCRRRDIWEAKESYRNDFGASGAEPNQTSETEKSNGS